MKLRILALALLVTGCASTKISEPAYCKPIIADVDTKQTGYEGQKVGAILVQTYENSRALCENAKTPPDGIHYPACGISFGQDVYITVPEGCFEMLVHEVQHVIHGPKHVGD